MEKRDFIGMIMTYPGWRSVISLGKMDSRWVGVKCVYKAPWTTLASRFDDVTGPILSTLILWRHHSLRKLPAHTRSDLVFKIKYKLVGILQSYKSNLL